MRRSGSTQRCAPQVYILDAIAKIPVGEAKDAESVVERVVPRLQHANSAVVLSAVKARPAPPAAPFSRCRQASLRRHGGPWALACARSPVMLEFLWAVRAHCSGPCGRWTALVQRMSILLCHAGCADLIRSLSYRLTSYGQLERCSSSPPCSRTAQGCHRRCAGGALQVVLLQLPLIKDEAAVKALVRKLGPPLVTLLSEEAEIQYVALRNISLICQRHPEILSHEIKARSSRGATSGRAGAVAGQVGCAFVLTAPWMQGSRRPLRQQPGKHLHVVQCESHPYAAFYAVAPQSHRYSTSPAAAGA